MKVRSRSLRRDKTYFLLESSRTFPVRSKYYGKLVHLDLCKSRSSLWHFHYPLARCWFSRRDVNTLCYFCDAPASLKQLVDCSIVRCYPMWDLHCRPAVPGGGVVTYQRVRVSWFVWIYCDCHSVASVNHSSLPLIRRARLVQFIDRSSTRF